MNYRFITSTYSSSPLESIKNTIVDAIKFDCSAVIRNLTDIKNVMKNKTGWSGIKHVNTSIIHETTRILMTVLEETKRYIHIQKERDREKSCQGSLVIVAPTTVYMASVKSLYCSHVRKCHF